jgi:hypothetical protein
MSSRPRRCRTRRNLIGCRSRQAHRGSCGDNWCGDEARHSARQAATRDAGLGADGHPSSRRRSVLPSRAEMASTATLGRARCRRARLRRPPRRARPAWRECRAAPFGKGHIVIAAAGPKVFTGSWKDQPSAAGFADARRFPFSTARHAFLAPHVSPRRHDHSLSGRSFGVMGRFRTGCFAPDRRIHTVGLPSSDGRQAELRRACW